MNLAELPERSIVTVLAVDTVNSTGHIAGEDPDDAQELLDRIFSHLEGVIGGAGGLFVSYAGDGGIAVFGWPQSMEDHADQACTAAWCLQHPEATLSLVDRVGRPVRFRVGLHSGLVGLRRMRLGRETRLDTVGGTVHLAAALQKKAQPGGILVSSKTRDLCHADLKLEPYADLPLFQSINAKIFQLAARPVRARARLGRRTYRTPLTGRSAERALLSACLIHRQGEEHAVALIGEPGIGKSRLASAVIDEARQHGLPMLAFHGDAQKRTTPFSAMRTLILELLSLGEDATDDAVVAALAKGGIEDVSSAGNPLATILLSAQPRNGAGAASPQQALPQTPLQMARELTLTFTRLAGAKARLIAIEDLHLVDPESLLCLRSLAEDRSSPWSLLVTARPEAAEEATGIARTVLRLGALPRQAMAELVAALWPGGPSSGELLDKILDRADGVPFTLEQIVLSASEGLDLTPQSVQSMIHARLNRLSASAKACAQALSVLGEEVDTEVALKVVDCDRPKMEEDLHELELLEIIHSMDGEAIRFRHAIVAEACAETVPGPRKRDLHRAAIDAVVATHADLGPHYERLAHHAEGARDDERALQYLWEGAVRANRSFAAGSLFLLFRRAMGHMERIGVAADKRFVDFVMMASGQLMQIGEFTKLKPHILRALELVRQQNRPDKVCTALCHMALVAWFEGDYREGRRSAEQALEIAAKLDALPLVFAAKFLLSSALYGLGEVKAAMALQQELSGLFHGEMESARLGAVALPASLTRSYISWFLGEMGRIEEGLPLAEEALAIAERYKDPYGELLARMQLGRNLLKLRRYEESADCLKAALALIRRYGYEPALPHIVGLLASALTGLGKAQDGVTIVQEWLQRGMEERTGRLELCYLNVGYAEALAQLGRNKEGLAAIDRGLGIARSIKNPCLIVQGLGLRAHLMKTSLPGAPQIAADLAEQAALCTRHGLAAPRFG